jgi:DNA-binding NarL/FixJ family response regulator
MHLEGSLVCVTIVCFDNTPIMLQSLKENACQAFPQADIQAFLTEEPALHYAQTVGCDILLCEINPPRLEGLFLAEEIQRINKKVNIIFVTVCSEEEYAKEVLKLKPSGYLTKEATNAQILEELKNLRYPVS